jgi:O-antigen/teichoic acid export membrane protein
LMLLIPAIVIFSGNIVVSHFFSGIGKVYYNTIVGAIGLVFTVITCLLLIPQFGLRGAAMAANLSYMAMFIAVMFCFIRCSKTSLRDYFSSGMSFKKVLSTIRKMTSGKAEE